MIHKRSKQQVWFFELCFGEAFIPYFVAVAYKEMSYFKSRPIKCSAVCETAVSYED